MWASVAGLLGGAHLADAHWSLPVAQAVGTDGVFAGVPVGIARKEGWGRQAAAAVGSLVHASRGWSHTGK